MMVLRAANPPGGRRKDRPMQATIEVERDEGGRLVGELDCTSNGRHPFIGLMELVGLIEDGLDADRGRPGPAGAPERT